MGLAILLLAGCGGSPAAKPPALTAANLDGVYTRTVSAQSVAKHDGVAVADATPENYGEFTLVIHGRRFAFTQHNRKACTWQYGKLAVTGDRMDWRFIDGGGHAPTNAQNKPGEHLVWNTTLFRATLSLRPVLPTDLTDEAWHGITGSPTVAALGAACPPPRNALGG